MFRAELFKATIVCGVVVAGLLFVGCKKQEHPAEPPEDANQKQQITKDELADAVEKYVKKQAAAQGGFFTAFDEKAGETLQLTLDKVHRKRLSKIADDTYFACADFRTPDGKVYDLDVFMRGADKDDLTFSKFTIHKEAGEERYTWYEQDGLWKKKMVEVLVEEHPKEPEHPEKSEDAEKSEHPKKSEDAEEHPKKSEHPE